MRLGLVAAGVVLIGAAHAAQPELEPGNWQLRIATTTNGKADPVQNSEECLGDELKDLGSYFAPALEGAQARCTKTRQPSSDPRKIVYRMRCTGSGFTVNAETSVTVENARHFKVGMRIDSKTRTEAAVVVADAEGRWAGACKPDAKK